jgi:transposase-like protein
MAASLLFKWRRLERAALQARPEHATNRVALLLLPRRLRLLRRLDDAPLDRFGQGGARQGEI